MKIYLFLTLFGGVLSLVGKHPCNDGFDTFSEFFGKCYRLFTDINDQPTSDSLCSSTWWHTAKLVSIHSQEEQDYIFNGIYTDAGLPNSYIGFEKDSPGSATYHWTDGTPHDFTATLKINEAGDTCFFLKSNAKWDDEVCTESLRRICSFYIPKCFGINGTSKEVVCSGSGYCIDHDECECFDNYYGEECNITKCFDVFSNETSACNGGTCVEYNNCSCGDGGFQPSPCVAYYCNKIGYNEQSACSGRGNCTATDTCECQSGYYGGDCQFWNCSGVEHLDGGCSSNGQCSSPENCSCNSGYFGDVCQFWNCSSLRNDDEDVCSLRGNCSLPEVCVCKSGYFGGDCEYFNCSNKRYDESGICSNRGNCTSPEKCECYEDLYGVYFGGNCEYFNCSGIRMDEESVCSSLGNCTSPEVCSCYDHYFGETCNVTTCNGVSSNDTDSVCSDGAGFCSSYEICDCFTGYVGDYCELLYPPPSINVEYSYYVGRCSEIIISTNAIGYGLTYYWSSSLSDFVPTQLPTQFIETNSIGVFNFTVFAKDYWGRTTSIESFEIFRTNFSLPFAFIEGPNEIITYVKDTEFSLIGYEEILCSSGENYVYSWEQIDPSSPVVDVFSENTKKLKFTNGFPFEKRKYKFRFTVSSVLGNSSADVTVDVRIRDVISVINDSAKSVPIDQALVLASQSFDPEESISVENFHWSCVFNVSYPCSSFVIVNDIVVFTPIKIGKYEISLNYSKDSRWSSTSLEFSAFDGSSYSYIPEIWIDSVPFPVNPSDKVNLNGNIKPHDEMSEVTFLWECDTISDLQNHVLSDDITSLVLILAPHAISESSVFTLYAFYDALVVSSSVQLRVNEPPKYGVIDVYPSRGKVFDDFQVSFQNWIDEDQPLEYSLEYVHVISSQLKLVRPFSIDNVFQFSISTQGCRKFNYSIELVANIKDYYGSKVAIPLEIFVEPIEFETIIEWIIFVNNYLRTQTVFDKRGLDNILKIYNIINPNCTSFSTQEKLCMNYDECLSTDVPNTEPVLFGQFQIYSLLYLKNFTGGFDPNQNINQLYQIWKSIVIREKDDYELVGVIFEYFDFFLEFLEYNMLSENIKIDMLQVFLDVVKKVYNYYSSNESPSLSVPEEEKFFLNVLKILKIFLVKLGYKEKNPYLSSSNLIFFEYLKHYSIDYRENKKLRIFEKEFVLNDIRVVIPSVISNYYALNKIINVIAINFDRNREKILMFFQVDNELVEFPTVLPSSFQIYFYNQSILSNESFSCEQKRTNFSSIVGEFTNCEETVVSDDGKSVECRCNFVNAFIRLAKIEKEENPEDTEKSNNYIVYIVIGVCFLALICIIIVFNFVVMCVIFCSVGYYKKQSKVFPIPRITITKSMMGMAKVVRAAARIDDTEVWGEESIPSSTTSTSSVTSITDEDFIGSPPKVYGALNESFEFENESEKKYKKRNEINMVGRSGIVESKRKIFLPGDKERSGNSEEPVRKRKSSLIEVAQIVSSSDIQADLEEEKNESGEENVKEENGEEENVKETDIEELAISNESIDFNTEMTKENEGEEVNESITFVGESVDFESKKENLGPDETRLSNVKFNFETKVAPVKFNVELNESIEFL